MSLSTSSSFFGLLELKNIKYQIQDLSSNGFLLVSELFKMQSIKMGESEKSVREGGKGWGKREEKRNKE